MGPLCDSCRVNVNNLNQQVSVMRKEIKNLRQMLESATRANRKHMTAIQSVVSNIKPFEPASDKIPSQQPQSSLPSPQDTLEQGIIQTVPIGYISSCFSVKNGTPRQPTICGPSKAELQIEQSVFNNPGHALVDLEQYSHVWIIFLFHKNGHLSYKAKVKPPRLNGQKVGVYSTRSPHRPNALGLTLAKLDKILGNTVHLSDIDMIAGTPVLDIKPYIPEYDSPQTRTVMESEPCDTNQLHSTAVPLHETADILNLQKEMEIIPQSGFQCEEEKEDEEDNDDVKILPLREKLEMNNSCQHSTSVGAQFTLPKDLHCVLGEVKSFLTQGEICKREDREREDRVLGSLNTKPTESNLDHPFYGEEAYSTIAGWIREPPVGSLDVRFTPNAERELAEFLPAHSGHPEGNRPRFRFLGGPEEAATAIRGVLSADPRSIYRRTRCRDRLFFFTLDTADITCWFGRGFAEVLQVRPAEQSTVHMNLSVMN